MKKFLFFLTLLVNGFLYAQERNEQLESMRIAYITRNLNLSPNEATQFWPVYNEFSAQIQSIRQKDKERTVLFRAKTAPDDQESEKYIADHLSFKQQEMDLTRKYIGAFRKVLPAYKVAQLITLDQEFKKQLLLQMKRQK